MNSLPHSFSSLIGSLYKLVTEVLATRLSKVMDELISSNQLAFLNGQF